MSWVEGKDEGKKQCNYLGKKNCQGLELQNHYVTGRMSLVCERGRESVIIRLGIEFLPHLAGLETRDKSSWPHYRGG